MTVRINRVYTRTGDDGTTGLGDFSRTAKTDPRLAAYADTDETGAVLGLTVTMTELDDDVRTLLRRVQNDLFDVGADLCLPLADSYKYEPLRVKQEWITELESAIDTYNDALPKLTSFILAGGTPAAAYLHLARTSARRAERSTWAAIEVYGADVVGGVNGLAATYLNRLSDLLFVLARYVNRNHGDVQWTPGGGR
ncbi:MAG: ATP:cob(I)alamin adenosyltransferase [Micrococcales bacterium]|nr:MAG: ATP:cob(I)alamin adenosyltransferase [Micrococcales bacterium]PIE27655.1 MAG: ATP:cob(I)alamin adenosyltransferase [Micrococcales bacterium]